jgi:hypothetical protein
MAFEHAADCAGWNDAPDRWKSVNDTCGALGYVSRLGKTGANLHPDRCVCQKDDPTPHKHYPNDPKHGCARCTECKEFKSAVRTMTESLCTCHVKRIAELEQFKEWANAQLDADKEAFRELQSESQRLREALGRAVPIIRWMLTLPEDTMGHDTAKRALPNLEAALAGEKEEE